MHIDMSMHMHTHMHRHVNAHTHMHVHIHACMQNMHIHTRAFYKAKASEEVAGPNDLSQNLVTGAHIVSGSHAL